MRYNIYEAGDYLKMPWKNGLGFTREIRREPAEGDFHWRLSIAQIKENGPFSSFPLYTRIINTLTGSGMILSVDGTKSRPLLKYDPFIFSGASAVESELIDGPIEDFNLIFNPDFYTANLKWLDADQKAWGLLKPLPGPAVSDITETAAAHCPGWGSVEISGDVILIYSVGGHKLKWEEDVDDPGRRSSRCPAAAGSVSADPAAAALCPGRGVELSSGATVEIINTEGRPISLRIEAAPNSRDRHFCLMEIRRA